MSTATTTAPSRAIPSAMLRPMPRAPPVTTATRSCSFAMPPPGSARARPYHRPGFWQALVPDAGTRSSGRSRLTLALVRPLTHSGLRLKVGRALGWVSPRGERSRGFAGGGTRSDRARSGWPGGRRGGRSVSTHPLTRTPYHVGLATCALEVGHGRARPDGRHRLVGRASRGRAGARDPGRTGAVDGTHRPLVPGTAPPRAARRVAGQHLGDPAHHLRAPRRVLVRRHRRRHRAARPRGVEAGAQPLRRRPDRSSSPTSPRPDRSGSSSSTWPDDPPTSNGSGRPAIPPMPNPANAGHATADQTSQEGA